MNQLYFKLGFKYLNLTLYLRYIFNVKDYDEMAMIRDELIELCLPLHIDSKKFF